ncbi:MAG: biopolymer transporter ExbD [Acidobacteria bacterium]|nr:biopolymer transporter ExbD [Acidobacteriota bacterium]
MKKLLTVCAACLVTITALLLLRAYSEYRRGREAAAALALFEKNRPERFRVEVPAAGAAEPAPAERLVVSITEGGALRLNSEETGTLDDLSTLRARLEHVLRERVGARPGRAVVVKASSRLKYAEVRKVVDAVRGAGADPVGLETDDPR